MKATAKSEARLGIRIANVVTAAREVDRWQKRLVAEGGLNPPGYCPPLERLRSALRELDKTRNRLA